MTPLDLPRSLSSGREPRILGKGYKSEGSVQIPRATHTQAHALTPSAAVRDHGTEVRTGCTKWIGKT